MLNWIIHSIRIVTVGVLDVLQVKIMFNSLLTGPSQKFLILLQWSLSLVKTLGGTTVLVIALLPVLQVFGFLSVFLWAVNIFWVVIDTSFYIRWKANRSGMMSNAY